MYTLGAVCAQNIGYPLMYLVFRWDMKKTILDVCLLHGHFWKKTFFVIFFSKYADFGPHNNSGWGARTITCLYLSGLRFLLTHGSNIYKWYWDNILKKKFDRFWRYLCYLSKQGADVLFYVFTFSNVVRVEGDLISFTALYVFFNNLKLNLIYTYQTCL